MMNIRAWIANKKDIIRIYVGSLFYNEQCNWDYVFDVALSPVFWFIDNYAGKLGKSFVVLCCLLMGCITVISYWIGLPFWWEKNPTAAVLLLIIGNWLMINCAFHYYLGIACNPGYPPDNTFFEFVASICKKCIQPKPHRTHHCSVCNLCILQMDHHCPWLNNCVGHFNRRYFFMFMVYIEISVLFLITFGVEIAYNEVWLHFMSSGEEQDLYGYPVQVNTSLPKDKWVVEPTRAESDYVISEEKYKSLRRRAILFTAIICLGVAIAIGTLLVNHFKMISKGETSIEKHINETERKKYADRNKVYVNPYDFGFYKNWTIFFGIENGSGRSWRHVVFPSAHQPFGDGIIWPNIHSTESEWSNFFQLKHQ
ncbi:palmitoyltransferase ZDHHC16B [Planococcus citri]|uniref:palmitoyltransferase ZDHHC16B n=1 Tax=Planococcus citri TaxID=170843 RepID=UPI0031F9895D